MKKKSAKNTKICPNCEEKFTPNHGKQIFCSDRCKVAHGRSKAKELGLVPASEIPPPEAPWIAKIKEFCNRHGITPEDLIEAYLTRNKKTSISLPKTSSPNTSYLERRRNLKLNNKE